MATREKDIKDLRLVISDISRNPKTKTKDLKVVVKVLNIISGRSYDKEFGELALERLKRVKKKQSLKN